MQKHFLHILIILVTIACHNTMASPFPAMSDTAITLNRVIACDFLEGAPPKAECNAKCKAALGKFIGTTVHVKEDSNHRLKLTWGLFEKYRTVDLLPLSRPNTACYISVAVPRFNAGEYALGNIKFCVPKEIHMLFFPEKNYPTPYQCDLSS